MRIVLAYSGGLDTSVAIPWLKEKYNAEIIAVTMDLGQGRELNQIRERAMGAGAVRCHVLDVREEFARDYILPALQAGAMYEERYPLATALGRPLIAKKLVEIAQMENATAIAHGCTGKGNDQVRIDVSARAIDPKIQVIAPARVWGMTRPEEIEYARVRNVPVPTTKSSPYSTDENLWGRSIECGILEDPWNEPPDDIYALTKSPAEAPDAPAYVEIEWVKGVPDGGEWRGHAADRAHRQPRNDRRRARRRPHRHGGKPPGRHQVARNLRSARGHRAAQRASRPRRPGHPERPAAPQAAPLAGVRRHRLQRPVVCAHARSDRCVRGERAAEGHRHGAAEALQGRLPRRGQKVAVRALRSRPRHLRRRRQVRSHRGGRLHQDLGPAGGNGGEERAAQRKSGRGAARPSRRPSSRPHGKPLVRPLQQRARSDGVPVRRVVQVRQASLRRRRDGQPRVCRGARPGGRVQRRRGGNGQERAQGHPRSGPAPAVVCGRPGRGRARLRRAPARRARGRPRQAPAHRPIAKRAGVAGSAAVSEAPHSCSAKTARDGHRRAREESRNRRAPR